MHELFTDRKAARTGLCGLIWQPSLPQHMRMLHCHGHGPCKVYISLTIAVRHSLWTPTTCSCGIGLWRQMFWHPSPLSTFSPYPRRTFTSTLIAGIMCVCRSWHTKSHFPKNLDARIVKVNTLLILQYVSFPWWSYIDRQLQGDKLSLDIDDLNEDGKELPRMRGRPHGTSQQPNVGVQLLDGNNKPHVFSADVLSQMSVVQLRTLCAAHGLSTCGTKAVFRERILRKQDHIEGPPKQYPTISHVSPPPSSIGDYPHLDARNCHFSIEYWPDERNDSIGHNVHPAECAWLSTAAVQCLLEVLLPQEPPR